MSDVHTLPPSPRIESDHDFVDSQPALTRAIVCGFLCARADGYAGTPVDSPETVEWARYRFNSMRAHPSFRRFLPEIQTRIEAVFSQLGNAVLTATPRQVAALATA